MAVTPWMICLPDCLWIGTDLPQLFRLSTTGPQDELKSIGAKPATRLVVGNIDDDLWPDLVLTNLRLIYPLSQPAPPMILPRGAADGPSANRSSSLTIPNAISAASGDLNADDHPDLVVSVHRGALSMKASSRIYLGDGSRKLAATGLPVSTEGADGVAIAKVSPQAAAVFANSLHSTLDSALPVRLYWGSAHGFSGDAYPVVRKVELRLE